MIISPEPWDFIKVSKHHYARFLASRDNMVYFLNPPDTSGRGIRVDQVEENLFVIDYKNPFPGIRLLPGLMRKFFNRVLYRRIERKIQARFDTVMLFENSRFYDLDFLPKKVLSIYFQVDEDQNFHPAEAAKTANLAIAINDVIRKILARHRTHVYQLGHGFSGQFTSAALEFWNGSKRYQRPSGRLKAYYIGNLENGFIDTELIDNVVRKMQDIDFVLVGPYLSHGKLYSLISDCSNVRFLGKMPAESIPGILDEADILFFAYRKDFLASSHKAMEYLASGKAIVTTGTGGYPNDPDLFYCTDVPEKFIALFRNVYDNIEEANHPFKMRKRIQFAMDNTYPARIEQIEKLIESS